MHPYLFIVLLSLPWNWQYFLVGLDSQAWCHRAAPAGFPERIGWYDGEIHIVDCRFDAETQRRYVHELDHHLTHYYGIDHYDWSEFLSVVENESLNWNEHQRNSAQAMFDYGGAFELHAELSNILDGQLPASLQPWYPWFDLISWIATPQEDAPGPVL